MSVKTKNYRSTDIYKFGDQGPVKKYYSKAHECFTELIVALSELSNSKEDKITGQKLRNQLKTLLSNPGEHGCFFPVRKMPIYQDIISGDFMRRAAANGLLATKQQLTMKQNTKTQAKLQYEAGSFNNKGHHLAKTLIGGGCMGRSVDVTSRISSFSFCFYILTDFVWNVQFTQQDMEYETKIRKQQQMNETNYTKFEEKDNEELTELLRLMARVSSHGSEEYKILELRTTELIEKFGGADNILEQLEKQRRYPK